MIRRSSGRTLLFRIIIPFALVGLVLMVMGFSEIIKDVSGSHSDFNDMQISDFRKGDIIEGLITESFGCPASITTTEYTLGFIQTNQYTSSKYYAIPFYRSLEEPVPDKIILFRTGNKRQLELLDRLEGETDEYYAGINDATYSHVFIDRAEVSEMTDEEYAHFRDYIYSYVEWYYLDYGSDTVDKLFAMYMDNIVPYTISYNAGGSNIMLIIGSILFGIAAVCVIVMIVQNHRNSAPLPYVSSGYTSYDNVNNPQYGGSGDYNQPQPGQGTNDFLDDRNYRGPGQSGSQMNYTQPPYQQNTPQSGAQGFYGGAPYGQAQQNVRNFSPQEQGFGGQISQAQQPYIQQDSGYSAPVQQPPEQEQNSTGGEMGFAAPADELFHEIKPDSNNSNNNQ